MVNTRVSLPRPRSRYSQDQELFLVPSADKQTGNYDTRLLKPPPLPISTKVKGIEAQQDGTVSHIYKFTNKCHSQTTPCQRRDSHGQETYLAPSADKQTCNSVKRVLKPPFFPINTNVKGIEVQQDGMVRHIYKFTSKCHSQTTPSHSLDSQGQEVFLAPSADKQICNYHTRVLKLPSLPVNTKVKGIEPEQDEILSHKQKFTRKCHSQTTPSSHQRQPGPGNVFSTLYQQANLQL